MKHMTFAARCGRGLALLAAFVVLLVGFHASTARAQPYGGQDGKLHTGPPHPKQLTISGSGFAPNTSVSLTLHSKPVSLGTVMTDASGSLAATVAIPAGVPDGSHEVIAVGQAREGGTLTLSSAVVVGHAVSRGLIPMTGIGDAFLGAIVGVTLLVTAALILLALWRRPNAGQPARTG